MAEAVALGERGRVTAPPNPWVGCVVVGAGGPLGGRACLPLPADALASGHALL